MVKILVSRLTLFLLITISVFLNSCSSGTQSPLATNNSTTTVLVYMIGSNLESDKSCPDNLGCGTYNLNQMMQVGSTSNMNVVVETGGSKTNGWNFVSRWQVEQNQLLLQQTIGPVNMATSTQITNFIQWGVTNYPADKYILVFWGHGGGPNGGYGGDDNYPSSDGGSSYISLPDITTAVQNSNTQFEIIGFDSCLMGTAEVVSALAPYTQYFVGSEDLAPGAGWNYESFLQYVTNNPNANGAQIGQEIVQGFTEQNANQVTTLSVIDTSLINNLVIAINTFAEALQPYVNSSASNWKAVANARLKSLDFNTSVFFGVNNSNLTSDLVDISNFATMLVNMPPFASDSNFTSAANNLIATVQSSVSYNQASPVIRSEANGLTLYYPSIMAKYESAYYTTNTQNGPLYQSAYTSMVNSYNAYYLAHTSSLTAQIQGSLTNNSGVISAQINNQPAQVFALGNGKNNCSLYPNYRTEIRVPCYKTLQPMFTVESSGGSNYTVTFNQNGAESTNWPTIRDSESNTDNIIMIPYDSAINTSESGISYYLVPVSKVDTTDGNTTPNQDGYLVIQNESGVLTAVNYQTGAGSNTQSIYAIESEDAFYMRRYARYNGVWQMLPDLSVLYKQPYTFSTNGSVESGSIFAFSVSDLTGALYAPESITY